MILNVPSAEALANHTSCVCGCTTVGVEELLLVLLQATFVAGNPCALRILDTTRRDWASTIPILRSLDPYAKSVPLSERAQVVIGFSES